MKKILTTITTAILATTIMPTVANSLTTSSNASWTWEDVNINHDIETPTSGTHWVDNTKTSIRATANSWDNFMTYQTVNANGYFALHTYVDANYLSQATLNLNSSLSNTTFREWDNTLNNDKWSGWGHQTATITLTLTATYNPIEKLTALFLTSYIYARTAGSVHECSTTCQISTCDFI